MPETNIPLIIAHRGASAVAPENTITAFRQAIEEGADGLEFDVRLTKDGIPVVFHDGHLRRICSKNFRVAEVTLEQLQTLDIGSWFNARNPLKANIKFSSETISTLQETLDFLSDFNGRIYVELKGKDKEIPSLVEAVAKIIQQSKLLPKIIVKSFKLDAIRRIKNIIPEARTAALFAPKILTILRKQSQIVEKALEYNADEMSLHFSLATQKIVGKAEDYGMSTIIWTADHPVWVKRASEIGLKAIITNNPARLLVKRHELLAKKERAAEF